MWVTRHFFAILKNFSILLMCIISLQVEADSVNVKLNGVEGIFAENILANLSLYQNRNAPNLTAGRIRWLYLQSEKEISTALQPLGYYHPVTRSSITGNNGVWQVTFTIKKGPPVIVTQRDIQIEGEANTDKTFKSAFNDKLLLPGNVARHDEYESIKKALLSVASERGYFDAHYTTNELLIDAKNNKAVVKLVMDSGKRYRLGHVNFNKVDLDEALLRRYIPFEYGDPYDAKTVRQLQKILSDSDYFENVIVQPLTDQKADQYIPVDVELSMRKRTKYTLGVGYGTDTGARASAGLERRFLNAKGHTFNGKVSVSEFKNSVHMQYSIPMNKPETDRLIGVAEWSDETTDTSNSELKLLSIGREQELSGWRNTLSLSYQEESFRVADDTGRSTLLMPSISFSQIRSDHPVIPTKGRRLKFNLRGSVEGIISDSSFLQARIGAKWLRTFNKGRLLLRGDVGTSWTKDFTDLPPSVRFFTGGDWSVRGYAYNTLGPQQSDGKVVGGKHLLVGSVEYDYLFKENWRAAVFYDMGNAIDDFNDALKKSAGVGVRWKSPVGWIRLDLARPLANNEGWRIHFTIGPDL